MKALFVVGALNGFLAVLLGAFGAHGLEGKISEKSIGIWEKAVLYQMFHTGSILAVGLTLMKVQSVSLVWAGWAFFIGIILFSGSLYLYSTTGTKTLAMITPFGGVVFLIGWVLFGYALIKVL
ncbi:MAG TPA: DUF423 domain-containing protein [Pseudogracilibacillus sp.]|nr:DUF423 domain-containing protein [Pseudogracilibacillus sp.]